MVDAQHPFRGSYSRLYGRHAFTSRHIIYRSFFELPRMDMFWKGYARAPCPTPTSWCPTLLECILAEWFIANELCNKHKSRRVSFFRHEKDKYCTRILPCSASTRLYQQQQQQKNTSTAGSFIIIGREYFSPINIYSYIYIACDNIL